MEILCSSFLPPRSHLVWIGCEVIYRTAVHTESSKEMKPRLKQMESVWKADASRGSSSRLHHQRRLTFQAAEASVMGLSSLSS